MFTSVMVWNQLDLVSQRTPQDTFFGGYILSIVEDDDQRRRKDSTTLKPILTPLEINMGYNYRRVIGRGIPL